MSTAYAPTPATTLHRLPARGTYDRAVVHAILDEALVCHLGFTSDAQPFVVPTTFVRDGETLYVHGAAASRALDELAAGGRACVTVTLLDGLVLARSAFHHSMNYRSVVVLGAAREVLDETEKRRALAALVEKVSPGRSTLVREPSAKELRATRVLAVPLEAVSAKIREGLPKEDAEDALLEVWAGVVPLSLRPAAATPEDEHAARFEPPALPPALADHQARIFTAS